MQHQLPPDLRDIRPIRPNGKSKLPPDFKKVVSLLRRPYTRITKAEYDIIMRLTSNPLTDFIMFDGKLCTFGDADGGYAIMPIDPNSRQYHIEAN